MPIYKTQERCHHGCKCSLGKNHIEIRRSKPLHPADARRPTIVLCKRHLLEVLKDNAKTTYGYQIACSICGTNIDSDFKAPSKDLLTDTAPPYVIEPVDHVLFNIKALISGCYASDTNIQYIANIILTEYASFLDSYNYPRSNHNIPDFDAPLYNLVEWFLDAVESIGLGGSDRMTIYGITYADIRFMVLNNLEGFNSQPLLVRYPNWANANTSNFLVHESCLINLLQLDWDSL